MPFPLQALDPQTPPLSLSSFCNRQSFGLRAAGCTHSRDEKLTKIEHGETKALRLRVRDRPEIVWQSKNQSTCRQRENNLSSRNRSCTILNIRAHFHPQLISHSRPSRAVSGFIRPMLHSNSFRWNASLRRTKHLNEVEAASHSLTPKSTETNKHPFDTAHRVH